MTKTDAPQPIPASTILICKDSPDGMETFMVVRHHQIDFASGALVFPGGKVDQADTHAEMRGFCDSCESLDDAALAFRVAGIRESFEECGVLFAREEGSDALISGERLATLEKYREPLNTGDTSMLDFVREENLRLACDSLHRFAHWVTPTFMPKRFDTHFFVARAPEDHVAAHDGGESVDSVWISPTQVMEESNEGKWTVIFPTKCNLMMLGESSTVDDAIAASNRRDIVCVEPWMAKEDGVPYIHIQPEAGYAISRERAERLG